MCSMGTTTLTDCSVSDNSSGFDGGGLVVGSGTTTLSDCTVSGNSALLGSAGGLGVYATIKLTDCTVSGNDAEFGGGLSNSGGTVTMTGCTVSRNSGYVCGGLVNRGTIRLVDTIVAGNSAGSWAPDVQGSFASQGNNLIGETEGSSGWVTSDLTGTTAQPLNPLLTPLGNYGGPTQTMALMPGSPAIDAAILLSGLTTDQRGLIRGSFVDIGAFQTSLVVESTASAVDTDAASLTLPAAVSLADQFAGSAISFDPNVFDTPQTITLSQGQLALSDTSLMTSITAPAASLTISGGGKSRVFEVDSSVTASFSGLTITGGSAITPGGLYNLGTTTLADCTVSGNSASGNGGGLVVGNGTTTLTDCTVSDNFAASFGGGLNNSGGTTTLTNCTVSGNSSSSSAGGLYDSGGTTTLTDCTVEGNFSGRRGGGLSDTGGMTMLTDVTISGNTASGSGGGINTNFGATTTVIDCTVSQNSASSGGGLSDIEGTLTLTDSTVSGNSASANGGGVYNLSSATLTDCTVSGNSAEVGGGLDNASGTTKLANTIIAGNMAGTTPDGSGTFSSEGNNLIGETEGSSGWVTSDLTGTTAQPLNPLLAPLGNYGGPTQTMALMPGSPAIDAAIRPQRAGDRPARSDPRRACRHRRLPDLAARRVHGQAVDTVAASLTLPAAVSLADQFPGCAITFDPDVFATPQHHPDPGPARAERHQPDDLDHRPGGGPDDQRRREKPGVPDRRECDSVALATDDHRRQRPSPAAACTTSARPRWPTVPSAATPPATMAAA